jgi:hypothetical protein
LDGIYYYPVVTYQYNDKLPCIYINNQRICTDQEIFQCQDSPNYNVTYHISSIPQEDFVRLNLWGGVPCNTEIRCSKGCNFTSWAARDYLIALRSFFDNAPVNFTDLFGLPSSIFTSFHLPSLRPENRAPFQPFLPKPVQIDEPPIHYIFNVHYFGLSCLNSWRSPPPSRPKPRPENPPVGNCLYIITSTGEKYVYHTCSEGQRCPKIDWRRKQEKGCPEKDYIVIITNCEGEPTTVIPPTPPQPLFPFCAWESVPLEATFTYYEIGEAPTHGGGLFVKRVIREVRRAKYYDIVVEGVRIGGKRVSYDPYGFLFLWPKRRAFAITNTPGFVHFPFNAGAITNDKNGDVAPIYLYFMYWRDDVPVPVEVIKRLLDKHKEECDSIPFCSTFFDTHYEYELQEHNKRAILPCLLINRDLRGGAPALRAYGFSYLERVNNSVYNDIGFAYLFNPSLFASGPDKYCKLTYDGYTWEATGTCDRCDVYVEMLNHVMKVCFQKKPHPFIEVAPFPIPAFGYERVGSAYFEASRYTCQCTVGDVVRFLNQIWPFEIYLSCPLALPNSDYFYIHGETDMFSSSLCQAFPLFLPCGAYKAPVTFPGAYSAIRGSYLIPCTEGRNVECVPQNARRIFWAFVPWVYQPCLCRERTTS